MYQERAKKGGDNTEYQQIAPLPMIHLLRVDCVLLVMVGLGEYPEKALGLDLPCSKDPPVTRPLRLGVELIPSKAHGVRVQKRVS